MLFLRIFICSTLILYTALNSHATPCMQSLQNSKAFRLSVLSRMITLLSHTTYLPKAEATTFVSKRHFILTNNIKGLIEHVQLRATDNDIHKQLRRGIIDFEDIYAVRQTQAVCSFLHQYMLKTNDMNPSFYYKYRLAVLTSALTNCCDKIHDYVHEEPCVNYALMMMNFAKTHKLDVIQPYQSVKILRNNLAQANFARYFRHEATPQDFSMSWQFESGKDLKHLLRLSFALCNTREEQIYSMRNNDFYDVLQDAQHNIKDTSNELLAARGKYYTHLINNQTSAKPDSFYNMVRTNEFESIQKETQRRLACLDDLKAYFEFCVF